MKILVLHAYSAANLGDGLLVDETLALIRKAFGEECEITIAASHPRTFIGLPVRVVDSGVSKTGYRREYLRLLMGVRQFDAVVAVGGGYLRAGTFVETLKTLLIHGPQLLSARYSRVPVVYLPQSIGPVKFGLRRPVEALLKGMDVVALRDDRSMEEFPGVGAVRFPDLALIGEGNISPGARTPHAVPVMSIRSIRGKVPTGVMELADAIGEFDVYVQSSTAGNDDRPATKALGNRQVITRDELLAGEVESQPRVIVAVRLHAALMALRAGHYVVHLAYERKGFGAFDDLGISAYVHNVNDFDVEAVLHQVQSLLQSEQARAEYRAKTKATASVRADAREDLIHRLRSAALPL